MTAEDLTLVVCSAVQNEKLNKLGVVMHALNSSNGTSDIVIRAVTSKGGTTQAAFDVLC